MCGSTASEHTTCPCISGRVSSRTLAIGTAPFSQAMAKTEPLICFTLIDQSKRSRLVRAVQVVPVPMISTDKKAKRTAASHGRNKFLYIPRRDEIILWGNRGSFQPLLRMLPRVLFEPFIYPVNVCRGAGRSTQSVLWVINRVEPRALPWLPFPIRFEGEKVA